METSLKPQSKNKFVQLFLQNRTYLIGIGLGFFLIVVNFYLGIYVVNLVLQSRNIEFVPGIALPEVNEEDYEQVKTNLQKREQKLVPQIQVTNDPFRT